MLDYIRANAQSWGIKAAFGIIILVFVFWGIGRMHSTPPTVAAIVNDETIHAQDLAREMQRMEENIRSNYPNITSEQLRSLNLQQQAEQMLIAGALLRQEAKRTGFNVSPLELRRMIEKNPIFLNQNGEFDPKTYLRVLELQRTTPGSFEGRMRQELLVQKLHNAVTASVGVSETEARMIFDFTQERRQVSYLLFPFEDYLGKVTLGEDEVRAEYESNRAAFTLPAASDVDYVLVTAQKLAKPDSVANEDAAAWYERNQADATQPERMRLRHILLRLPEDAPESDVQKARQTLEATTAKLKKGADFAALAKQQSQDPGSAPDGGELGWIQRGQTVPAFETAALALKPGQISEPVRTQFGLHLIKMEAYEAQRTRSFDEMRDEIRILLAEQKAAEHLRDVLDSLIEANIIGTHMDKAARAAGLEVWNTGFSTAAELQAKLGVDAKGAATLLAVPAGSSPDTPLEAKTPEGTGFIVAKIRAAVPEKVRDLAEVKEEIQASLTRKKARELALAAAERIRRDMGDGQAPAALAARVKQSAPMGRTEPVADFGADAHVSKAVFNAQTGIWIDAAFAVEQGAVLLRLDKCFAPQEESWKNIAVSFIDSLNRSRKEESFQNFVNLLASKAKIERKQVNFRE
ncbi:MAG: SurA N-terminal domain-containing protein [Deltaproteobacteria bacterium]|jgi:peptidyl-prolyl cis-trans isomerase D|nr:SurA N-terminal domain-containing protein [Deltaproteobacteria bacterium]